jgi:hypothetical protein
MTIFATRTEQLLLSHPEDLNLKLATKVLKQVTNHPRSHDQTTVMDSCGTVGCIAGWTCVCNRENPRYATMYRAEALLGLTHYEAGELFSGGATESDARALLARWIKQAEEYRGSKSFERAEEKRRVTAQHAEEKRQRAYDRAARRQRWTMWTVPKFRRTKATGDGQTTSETQRPSAVPGSNGR